MDSTSWMENLVQSLDSCGALFFDSKQVAHVKKKSGLDFPYHLHCPNKKVNLEPSSVVTCITKVMLRLMYAGLKILMINGELHVILTKMNDWVKQYNIFTQCQVQEVMQETVTEETAKSFNVEKKLLDWCKERLKG